MILLMSRETPPRSRPSTDAENVDDRRNVVVRDLGHAGSLAASTPGWPSSDGGAAGFVPVTGVFTRSCKVSVAILRRLGLQSNS